MARPILFIDRDGTLIVEPAVTQQIDSLDKLEFLPQIFNYLGKIAEKNVYDLVIVSNQDGLGTDSYPVADFHLSHNKMLEAFKNENIIFKAEHIDRTFQQENASTRKPNTGMLTEYINNPLVYDLPNSFVIGDRLTDIILAKNLGCKGILIHPDAQELLGHNPELKPHCALTITHWRDIYYFLHNLGRTAHVKRKTKETDIEISLALNGSGASKISTGLHFFDHMLDQIARHSLCDLTITTKGDLHIDEHHTIEDTALALGEAFKKALGDKRGVERYGFCLPMDDALAQVGIDFGGRPWCVWNVNFKRERIGDVPTEMFFHFFKSFSDTAFCNLNVSAEGENEHHKIESIFKAFAKAIKMAVRFDERNASILPSTKGVL